MIVLHCRKPRFLSLPVSPQIYRSKSAKFQLCITARRIIILRRTAPGHFVLCFCLLLNPDTEIMLNLPFNTLLTITPHNTQKRRRRKERTTYGPWRRYSRLVTHPLRNPRPTGLNLSAVTGVILLRNHLYQLRSRMSRSNPKHSFDRLVIGHLYY